MLTALSLLVILAILVFTFRRVVPRSGSIMVPVDPEAVLLRSVWEDFHGYRPHRMYRSGKTPEELRKNLEQELLLRNALLPLELEFDPGSKKSFIPEAPHKPGGTYDGWIEMRIVRGSPTTAA